MTVVEFLKEKIKDNTIYKNRFNDELSEWQDGYNVGLEELNKILIQASELFEQQIKDAYVYGFKECEKIHEEVFFIQDLSDDYYLQTFKKDKL